LQRIHIELDPDPNQSSTWEIVLSVDPGSPTPIAYDAWIDLDTAPESQSSFSREEAERVGTLASLGCGERTISVGAYYEIPEGQPVAFMSSEGPTRDGRPKPDVAAPGYQVQSANASGGPLPTLTAPMSGTSVSAAHVSGLAALLFQTDAALDYATLGDLIRQWTQLIPPTFEPPGGGGARNWDPRLGYGRIDAAQSLWNQ
jgi:subtilisin family serine protease